MESLIKLNDEIAVGGPPSREDLEALRREGFRSVVNLRRQAPSVQDRERDETRRLGMKYAHIPLAKDELDDVIADRLAVVLTSLDKPVFVHCAGSTTEKIQARGVDVGSLERFVRKYLERRSRKGQDAAGALTEWMDRLIEDAKAGRIAGTSAGAGRDRDYAYLHYRTRDNRHSVVVFRPASEGAYLRTFTFEDEPGTEIADLVDRVTHPRSVAR